MKRYLIGLIALTLFFAFTSTTPASAQTSTYSLHVSFGSDLAAGHYLWENYLFTTGSVTSERGNPIDGGGTIYDTDDPPGYHRGLIIITLPDDCLLENWSYQFYYGSTYGSAQTLLEYNDGTETWDYLDFNAGAAPQGVWNTRSDTVSSIAATELRIDYQTPSDSESVGEIVVDNIKFTCSDITEPTGGVYGGPFQPIAEELQIDAEVPRFESGLISGWSRITATTQNSIIPNTVPVYSPVAGTVSYVDQAPPYRVEIIAEVNGEQWEIEYFNLANVYVQLGDDITAGCIIGYAGDVFEEVGSDEPGQKQIMYRIFNSDAIFFEDWTLHSSPNGTAICGSLNQSESCLSTNPHFVNNAAGWTLNRGLDGKYALALNDAVTLQGISSISQYVELEEAATYYVTVSVALLSKPSGVFLVSVGGEEIQEQIYADEPGEASVFGVKIGEPQTILVGPFTTDDPDLVPNLYNVVIKNGFLHSDIRLEYACLHELGVSPVDNYGTCYFPSLEPFTTNGEEKTDPLGTPFIRLLDTEYLAANITLSGYDTEDATYNIDVSARAYSTDSDDDPATATTLVLSFDDGTDYADIASHELDPAVWENLRYTVVIPAGDEITADLTLTHDQDEVTDSLLVDVTRICLWPDAGYYPGFEPPPNGRGAECEAVLAPESFSVTNIGPWLSWLWESIKVFFTCLIPREIQRIVDKVEEIITAIGSFGTWLVATAQLFARWFVSMVRWLVTLINNALVTMFAAFWGALIQIPIVVKFFELWDLAQLLISGVIATLMAALNLVVLGFRTLATFAQVIGEFWASLQIAINETETASTGLPPCAGMLDTNPFYPTCLTIDLISYIIAQFPNTQFPIGVAGAFLALYTMIKTISWYRDSFAEVS